MNFSRIIKIIFLIEFVKALVIAIKEIFKSSYKIKCTFLHNYNRHSLDVLDPKLKIHFKNNCEHIPKSEQESQTLLFSMYL